VKTRDHYDSVPSSRDIRALIASYRQSGLGLERFARKHQIPPGRLHYWLYQKYRAQGVKHSRNGSGLDPVPLFQEVNLETGSPLLASWAAEVRLDSQRSIRFSATADPGWIGAVIQAVERPC
jgi:transposase-like protein